MFKGNPVKTVCGTYRIAEGYGQHMNRRWEVQIKTPYGWQMDVHGTKEFCEEALQFRIDHAEELKKKREELRCSTWDFALSM